MIISKMSKIGQMPELKFCPSKVNTQIHTKIFRKLAVQS